MVIVGAVAVFVCVFGAFAAHGGNLGVLWQPAELVIIGGAALGSLLISAPMPLIKAIIGHCLGALKDGGYGKEGYMQLLQLLFELCKTAKVNPLSLEPHVEKPEASEIFKKYPKVLADHHAIHFICDTLKVQISAAMNPYDLEELMDLDIASAHEEELKIPAQVSKVSDALPGLGIVAAVLGVVNTMGKLTEGKEVIGHSVAAALVGTFLGILASYGFAGPLATKIENNISANGKALSVIKSALLAFAKDCSPKVCVEFGRRSIPPECRPSFEEVDKATSGGAAKAA